MAAANTWIDLLKSAQKTCVVLNGRRKIHYTFVNGSEMVEEYDLKTCDLMGGQVRCIVGCTARKLKVKPMTGGAGKWEFEVGQDTQRPNLDSEGIVESSSNPICTRKDTKKSFEWRIRNLPYPLETYDVRVSDESDCIIVRTSNKKYYKKFQIPDMVRLKLKLVQSSISIAHSNNTLIITYKKPSEVLEFEQQVRNELQKLKDGKEGDMEMCPVS